MSAAGGNFWGFEDLKCRISFTKMHFSISNPLKNFACGGLFMFGFLYKTCKYYRRMYSHAKFLELIQIRSCFCLESISEHERINKLGNS